MRILKQYFILCVFILNGLLLNAQNTWLDKKVNLPMGRTTLKAALKYISTQTGCVFSYDPTKVVDSHFINISKKGTQSLRSTLWEILPKNIQFIVNGKYIVLQESSPKKVAKTANKPLKTTQSGRFTRSIGTIDSDPKEERLVLPPVNPPSEVPVKSLVVQSNSDSTSFDQERKAVQPADTNLVVVMPDTLSKKRILTIKPDTGSRKENAIIPAIKIRKSGLGDFLKKDGYLEAGVLLNKQLGAFAIHAGLYDVYSILSIGSDYHDSYLFGIGVGARVKLEHHFSLNFDLIQNSLVAGKSYLLNVRASNTQLVPILNYTIASSFKIFAGPTLNFIKSKYEDSISSTDLGVLVDIGFSAGIKIDLKSLMIKHTTKKPE